LAATVDVRSAIGFSSFAVLIYYAVANASAFTLGPDEGRPHRAIPLLGLLGCVVLAFAMPLSSMLSGVAVLGVGAAAYALRRVGVLVTRKRRGRSSAIPLHRERED
jgi:APA family basic amino acid/polyamine antiporter